MDGQDRRGGRSGAADLPVRWVAHGHFYQPPRENPWTEFVPVEPSAAPFHDWNERITAECYRPNGWARIVDDDGSIAAVVNNYAYLSFDVGPTLLCWLEAGHPEVYRRILDADRGAADRGAADRGAADRGAAERRGGRAMAQAYNHAILPLCNDRDLRTQVRWGLADFAYRFGRPAEGMWLPETAVNDAVLAVLAEEGVAFTILAPHQAAGVVHGGRPYRWRHPRRPDLGVTLVFYDGALSHDLAFGVGRLSSRDLVARVLASAGAGSPVCVAVDGETFGHHHKFTDRTLAYAFAHEAPAASVRVLSAVELIEEVPPVAEVSVRASSWSCAHGFERWRADCGCATGGGDGWNQRWRAPLRDALDWLRDHAAAVFDRRGAGVLADPWAARDAYVDVVLGRLEVEDFLADHGRPGSTPDDVVVARTLLEAQRSALLMYTSCGWFFNDLAGIETVQVLRYAARVMDLLAELGEAPPREGLLGRLARAVSNVAGEGSGADVWARHVEPVRVDAGRVVAHLALTSAARPPQRGRFAAFDVAVDWHRQWRRDGAVFAAAALSLTHRRTGRRSAHVYAVMIPAAGHGGPGAPLEHGQLAVYGASRLADPSRDPGAFAALRAVLDAPGDGRGHDGADRHGHRSDERGAGADRRGDGLVGAARSAIAEHFGRPFGSEAVLDEAMVPAAAWPGAPATATG